MVKFCQARAGDRKPEWPMAVSSELRYVLTLFSVFPDDANSHLNSELQKTLEIMKHKLLNDKYKNLIPTE